MNRLATRRLIDASATLDAADRALLNIWVHRGLDDAAVARMTGLSEERIAERRERMVAHLSAELGLPPEDIRSALTEIAPSADDELAAAAAAPEVRAAAPTANGTAPELSGTPPGVRGGPPRVQIAPTAATGPAPEPGSASSARRRRWPWGAAALLAIIVAIVLVIALTGGSSSDHGARPRSTTALTRTVSAPPASFPAEPMAALPGSLGRATGTAQITRAGRTLRLHLSVRNLPALPGGHDEVWLYNLISNADDLGRLASGVTSASFALPGDASRFQWIDISFQPVGHVFNSGESLLRSVNPAFAAAPASRP